MNAVKLSKVAALLAGLSGALLTLVVAFCRNAAGAGKWRT